MAKKWSDMNEDERKAAKEAEALRRRRNGQAMYAQRRASFLESHPELAGLPEASVDALIRLGERPRVSRPGGIPGSPAADTPQTLAQADRQRVWDDEWNRIVSEGTRSARRAAATAYKPNDAAPASPTSTAPATETVSPAGTSAVAAAPTSAQPAATSTPALNPASGSKRTSAPTRAPLVSVGRDGHTGTTITVNGQGMRPTAENMNLVEGLQRRRLMDNVNPNLSDAVITNAELRNFQRENGQIALDRARWARRDEILKRGRERSDKISWDRGEVRNARDWEHYGTVASAEGWKKGSDEYNSSMTALRDKMKTLQGLADAGYMPSAGEAMTEFSKLIEGSDAGAGLTQKQVEVANKQLDSWLGGAQNRQARAEAKEAFRVNQLRMRMGLAEGTSTQDVLAADRAVRGKAVSGALDALRDPEVWNGPDYYKHLETIQRNAGPNEGLASSFKAAMRDPSTRQLYNDAVTKMTAGGMVPDNEGVADLQNKIAIEHMQSQRSAAPVTAPQTLTDEEKRRLGIQAAQGAGDALRPRRKGVA